MYWSSRLWYEKLLLDVSNNVDFCQGLVHCALFSHISAVYYADSLLSLGSLRFLPDMIPPFDLK